MLPNHEEFARVQLTTALRQDGVEILTARRVVRLGRTGDAYVVTTSDDARPRPTGCSSQSGATRRPPTSTSTATGPQSQIAAAVGCSQMHVSRILAASLEALCTQAVAKPTP
jgi:hypothetical protein